MLRHYSTFTHYYDHNQAFQPDRSFSTTWILIKVDSGSERSTLRALWCCLKKRIADAAGWRATSWRCHGWVSCPVTTMTWWPIIAAWCAWWPIQDTWNKIWKMDDWRLGAPLAPDFLFTDPWHQWYWSTRDSIMEAGPDVESVTWRTCWRGVPPGIHHPSDPRYVWHCPSPYWSLLPCERCGWFFVGAGDRADCATWLTGGPGSELEMVCSLWVEVRDPQVKTGCSPYVCLHVVTKKQSRWQARNARALAREAWLWPRNFNIQTSPNGHVSTRTGWWL